MSESVRVEYDAAHERLVYLGHDHDEAFWDAHWAGLDIAGAVARSDPFVTSWTRRYLSPPARVLDAGCGMAGTVAGLQRAGFDAMGIDSAPQVVAAINRCAPDLNVQVGDVRSLPFDDGSLDGIWSLGVIEHFPGGYAAIIDEMRRALRPGGYAFVTVPSMSPLRRIKARAGAYPPFGGDFSDFYQFVLSPESVEREFSGWELVRTVGRGGFKGLKDEAGPLRRPMQALYDMQGARIIRAALNRALAPITYHTRLYVFRKPLAASR